MNKAQGSFAPQPVEPLAPMNFSVIGFSKTTVLCQTKPHILTQKHDFQLHSRYQKNRKASFQLNIKKTPSAFMIF